MLILFFVIMICMRYLKEFIREDRGNGSMEYVMFFGVALLAIIVILHSIILSGHNSAKSIESEITNVSNSISWTSEEVANAYLSEFQK